jgi:hypothetical protein
LDSTTLHPVNLSALDELLSVHVSKLSSRVFSDGGVSSAFRFDGDNNLAKVFLIGDGGRELIVGCRN